MTYLEKNMFDDDEEYFMSPRAIIAGCIIAFLLGIFIGANAQAQEHPAFGNHQVTQMVVTSDVPDIPKLEAKAVDILRKWDPTLTLTDARAKVRVDGKTDVARCMEYIIINALDSITQAHVSGITQAQSHPVSQ